MCLLLVYVRRAARAPSRFTVPVSVALQGKEMKVVSATTARPGRTAALPPAMRVGHARKEGLPIQPATLLVPLALPVLIPSTAAQTVHCASKVRSYSMGSRCLYTE